MTQSCKFTPSTARGVIPSRLDGWSGRNPVDAPAAITWPGDAPAIGVGREDGDETSEALSCGASFEFALADVLYREIKKGWIQMPSAPDSLEERPQILKEWGKWGWGRH
jgi:hypothetical protein